MGVTFRRVAFGILVCVGSVACGEALPSAPSEPGSPTDTPSPAPTVANESSPDASVVSTPRTEPCNGLDDNGNGAIDEGCPCGAADAPRACFTGNPSLAGIGVCSLGHQTCVPHGEIQTWSDCEGAGAPKAEQCGNGLDDDCNGSADDGCECPPGTERSCFGGEPTRASKGTCHAGTQTCGAQGTWGTCLGQVLPKAIDACDGTDEDCDGIVDNECKCSIGSEETCYTGPAGTMGVGSCRSGTHRCEAKVTGGSAWATCSDVPPKAETSYDRDDDCNGKNDYVCIYQESFVAGKNTVLSSYPEEDGVGTAARFGLIIAMAPDPMSGDLVVGDWRFPGPTFSVRKVTPAGVVTTLAKDVASSSTIAVGPDGTIYLPHSYTITKIAPAAAPVDIDVTKLGTSEQVTTLAVAPNGKIWVGLSTYATDGIASVAELSAGGEVSATRYPFPELSFIQSLVAGPNGELYASGHSFAAARTLGIYRLDVATAKVDHPLDTYATHIGIDPAGHLTGYYGTFAPNGRLLANTVDQGGGTSAFLYGSAYAGPGAVWGVKNNTLTEAQGYVSEVWRFSGCTLP